MNPESFVSVSCYPSSQASVMLMASLLEASISTAFITELTKPITVKTVFSGLFRKQQQMVGPALTSNEAMSQGRAPDYWPVRKQFWDGHRRRLGRLYDPWSDEGSDSDFLVLFNEVVRKDASPFFQAWAQRAKRTHILNGRRDVKIYIKGHISRSMPSCL